MDIDELVARESVRDLIARYNSTADSGRFDDTMALFADDAVMQLGDDLYEGREAIRGIFVGVRDSVAAFSEAAPRRYLRHHTATHQIDLVSATEARARSYFEVLMPHGLDHWGRYLDEFGRRDGAWWFTRRRVVIDGRVSGGWAARSGRGS